MSFFMYKLLVAFRIILVFVPQHGYIHPDEHFQCPEIVYGDVLQLQSLRTWEFNSTQPLRSVAFPYFTAGISALTFNILGFQNFFGSETYTYLLLILPRLVMCLLTFIHDISLYKLCVKMKHNSEGALTVFASSYVCLTYYLRTFSNSIEALFFTLLIYIVSKNTVRNKTKLKIDFQSNLYATFVLGVIISTAFVIRPTFLFFALSPILYWLFLVSKSGNKWFQNAQILSSFILGSFSSMLVLIAIDSLYFNQLHYTFFPTNLGNMLKHTVFTPLNFILYNMKSKNLITHGIHPKFLHLAINTPLLFSLLGLFLLFDCLKIFYTSLSKKVTFPNKFIIISCILPIFFLSCYRHQEPRFLIALLFPLSYLYGDRIFNNKRKVCMMIWFLSNTLGLVIFGHFHQGGMFPALKFLHTALPKSGIFMDIVFYRTYMPPRYLLAIPESMNNVAVHDYGGIEQTKLNKYLYNVVKKSNSSSLYVVTQHSQTHIFLRSHIFSSYNLIKQLKIFPHLSTENLPPVQKFKDILNNKNSFSEKLIQIKDLFSISILIFERCMKP